MDERALTDEELVSLRAMVDERVEREQQSNHRDRPRYGSVRPVTWQIACLREDQLVELSRTLAELRFLVEPVAEQVAAGAVAGVVDVFYTLDVVRPALFTRDALQGEALVLEAAAVRWDASVQHFFIENVDNSLYDSVQRLRGTDDDAHIHA